MRKRKYDQYVRFEAPYPNSIWQADHHQLDIIVVDRVTGEAEGRPWITKIQDDHSRAIMGYYLSMDPPSSMSIASALYHAFLSKPQDWWTMYGLPGMIYIDNGRDWISRHIELVALKFEIELRRHEPYHPQSKGKVERLCGTLEQMAIHPNDGAVGSSIRTRPRKVEPSLTLEQLQIRIERFIREYHERTHGATKQKPRERWEQNLRDHRRVENLVDIDHLLKSKQYMVRSDGILRLGNYYRDRDAVLGGFIGRRVTVFFDSRDTSCIRIWGSKDVNGDPHYLCTAYRQNLAPTEEDRANVAKANKQRRDATRKEVRETQKAGNVVLKQLEEMEARQDEAEAQHSSTSSRAASPEKASVTISAPVIRNSHSHSLQNSSPPIEDDNEPDYDEIRRRIQRKQRQEGLL
jgi:putative transposase